MLSTQKTLSTKTTKTLSTQNKNNNMNNLNSLNNLKGSKLIGPNGLKIPIRTLSLITILITLLCVSSHPVSSYTTGSYTTGSSGSYAENSEVIINEIMYNPPTAMGDDSDFEWIELYNRGTDSVELEGWTLTYGGKTMNLYGSINPDGYLVIARELNDGTDSDNDCFSCYYTNLFADLSETPSENGSSSSTSASNRVIDGPSATLSNTAGTITLCNPEQNCNSVEYIDDWGGDGDGSSLEFNGSEWLPSNDHDAVYEAGKPDGTPAERNSRMHDNSAGDPNTQNNIPEFSSLTAGFTLISSLIVSFKYRKKTTHLYGRQG